MAPQEASVEDLAEIRHLIHTGRAKAIREDAHISQSELARDLGVSQAAVARWESHDRLPRGAVAATYLRRLRSLERLIGAT